MAPPSPDACLKKHLHETRIFISDSHLRALPPFFSCAALYKRNRRLRTLDVESTVVGCIKSSPSLSHLPLRCCIGRIFHLPLLLGIFALFFYLSSCTPKGLTNRVSLKSHFSLCFMLCYLSSAAPTYQNCRDSKAGLVSAYGRYM
ncbi:hypothetical protein J3E69DRAFT_238930 [Trichoderma sp. SZMC 28015]